MRELCSPCLQKQSRYFLDAPESGQATRQQLSFLVNLAESTRMFPFSFAPIGLVHSKI